MKRIKKLYLFLGLATVFSIVTVLFFAGKDTKAAKQHDAEPEEVESCGVERWDVKVLADADASSVNIVPVTTTIDSLTHITTPYPDPNMARQAVEKQVYTVHCTVGEVKLESDGDYHLTLIDGHGNSMIGEIPDPTCPATQNSLYLGDIIRCRKFIDAHYTVTGSFQTINAKMVVTGVTFVDPPHGQTDAAPNNMEIHSITDIGFEPVNNHTSGIAENQQPNGALTVFPNPVANQATFKWNNASATFATDAHLTVLTIQGKQVMDIPWPKGQNQLTFNRGTLPSGTYFYRLMDGNSQVAVGRMMLE